MKEKKIKIKKPTVKELENDVKILELELKKAEIKRKLSQLSSPSIEGFIEVVFPHNVSGGINKPSFFGTLLNKK